nr:MAG TPA: minor capsid protein [Caudoviricetes sp.]
MAGVEQMDNIEDVVNPLGLHGYNCRHSHKPWDKSLRNPYVDADGNPKIDIHESQKLYDLHQKQRAMERAIRKTKRQLIIKEQEMKAFPNDLNIQSDYDKLSASRISLLMIRHSRRSRTAAGLLVTILDSRMERSSLWLNS